MSTPDPHLTPLQRLGLWTVPLTLALAAAWAADAQAEPGAAETPSVSLEDLSGNDRNDAPLPAVAVLDPV